MNKTEQVIINIMKALYDINEEHEKKLVDSFAEISEEDKKKIAMHLYKFYEKTNDNLKNLVTQIEKINIEMDEYKDKLGAESILDQIDW